MQSSTAELITGLVQLVPLTNSTQLSQEAMEVSSSSFFRFSVKCGSILSFVQTEILTSVENSFSFHALFV